MVPHARAVDVQELLLSGLEASHGSRPPTANSQQSTVNKHHVLHPLFLFAGSYKHPPVSATHSTSHAVGLHFTDAIRSLELQAPDWPIIPSLNHPQHAQPSTTRSFVAASTRISLSSCRLSQLRCTPELSLHLAAAYLDRACASPTTPSQALTNLHDQTVETESHYAIFSPLESRPSTPWRKQLAGWRNSCET